MKRWHEIGRIVFSLVFFVGAIVNTSFVISNPGIYTTFADETFLPIYLHLWKRIVLPNVHLMVGLVICFEIILSILLLMRGLIVRIALVLAAAFMMFLFPFWWAGAAVLNLVFSALLLWLASSGYPKSALELCVGIRRSSS